MNSFPKPIAVKTIQQAGAVSTAVPVLDEKEFDAEAILPISLIREHTKTDDVPHVTDSMLALYRSAALRAAAEYTGMLLSGQKVVRQSVSEKGNTHRAHRRGWYKVELKYPTVDGVVYLYGGKGGASLTVRTLTVDPGATSIRVPVDHYVIDASPCCGDPCKWTDPCNAGMTIMYRAGLSCEQDMPACIVMGALKYIAWQIENPGAYVDNATRALPGVSPEAGPNNAAWQSGAIEEWRICMRDAY